MQTDDPAVVERLSDDMARVICPAEDLSTDHACPVPWFVVSSELEAEEAGQWEGLMNT